MRVTLNVLHREAVSFFKEKGYEIMLDYIDTDGSDIFCCKSSVNRSIKVSIDRKESCYIYTIATNTSNTSITVTKNYLASLMMFIRKEV